MKKPLLVGNWKMHGSTAGNAALLSSLGKVDFDAREIEMAVCVPFVYIEQATRLLADSAVSVGAQNLCAYENGPYTGEVSASMLADFGVRYAIVGHSERRSLFQETDVIVADKMLRALDAGLTPIICVGETLEEREAGETLTRITAQLDAVLQCLPKPVGGEIVVAYEPLWAIGTGQCATVDQIAAVHDSIAWALNESGFDVVSGTRILYGGSVTPDSARTIFAVEGVDGALVGGASLSAVDFLSIFEHLKKQSETT